MCFVGLELKDKVPDAKIFWFFKDELLKNNVERKSFPRFSQLLEKMRVIQNEGWIVNYTVTNAAIHDSNELKSLIKSKDKIFYADSLCVGKENEVLSNVDLKICRRNYRKRPLAADDKKLNKAIIKIRCRIEHIFGFMTNSMHHFL